MRLDRFGRFKAVSGSARHGLMRAAAAHRKPTCRSVSARCMRVRFSLRSRIPARASATTTKRAAGRRSRRGRPHRRRQSSRRTGPSKHVRRCALRSNRAQSRRAPTTSSGHVRQQQRHVRRSSRVRSTGPTTSRPATSTSRNVSKHRAPHRFNPSARSNNLGPLSSPEPSNSLAQSSHSARSSALRCRCAR